MSDKRRFFKHTLIFGFGGIIVQLVPFILLPLYTNYLTPSEYGILHFIFLASEIIGTVFLIGGIRLAAMTFYKQAESEEARRRIAVTISSLLWIAIAAAIAVSIYFIDYIHFFLNPDGTEGEKTIFAFGLAVILIEGLVTVPLTLIQARLESLRFVLTNIVMAFTRLGLCVYFVAGLHWGIWGFLYAQAITYVVFGIYLTCRELWIGSICPDVTKWKEILIFTLPLVPNGILAFIYGSLSRLSILHMSPYDGTETMAMVGLYGVAAKIMSIAPFLGVRPMQQVWTAEMYDVYKKTDAPSIFGGFMLRLLCVQAFAVLLVSLFAWEIVRTMCDSSFHDAAALIPLFGVLSLLTLFSYQMSNTFAITRKTNYAPLSTLFSLPLILAFMFLFVPRWGITGVVIAQVLAQAIYIGIVYFFTQRLFAIRYSFGKMLSLLIITIFCYLLSLFCGSGVELSALANEQFKELSRWEKLADAWNRIQWVPIIVKTGILFLWGIFIWFSGIISEEDKALIRRVFRRGLQKCRSTSSFLNLWV